MKIKGKFTKEGIVFKSTLRIIQEDDGEFLCDPLVIAEPGDLMLVEGELLSNLTRAASGDPRVSFYAATAKFDLMRA